MTIYQYPGDTMFFQYPKTATALFYRDASDANPLWGWEARVQGIREKIQEPWQYQHRFKLHLADKHTLHGTSLPPLPPHKTAIDGLLREQEVDHIVSFDSFKL